MAALAPTFEQVTTDTRPPRFTRLPRRLVRWGCVWAVFLLILAPVSDPTPENWTLSISIFLSGVYTYLLYRTRSRWLPRLSQQRPLRNAMLLGIFNAAVIETLFLVVQHIMGADGVAASPNLIIDLIVTMPWYTGFIIIFVGVQHRYRFSPWIVLLLGGLYEVGGDGIVGGLIDGHVFTPAWFALITLLAFWEFMLVYSSMVLPPAWVIDTVPAPERPSSPAWRAALKPMLWIFPFTVYVLGILVLAGAANG